MAPQRVYFPPCQGFKISSSGPMDAEDRLHSSLLGRLGWMKWPFHSHC